jgi:hypothetical protein
MSKPGQVRTPAKRTGGAHKVSEWRIGLPGGDTAVFDIGLEFSDDGGIFTATSKHPSFQKFKIGHSDINILKERLEDHALDLVRTALADGWEPARVVEVRTKDYTLHGSRRVSVDVVSNPVEYTPENPVGNRGETRLRTDREHMTIIQRSMNDDFSDMKPKSGCLTDPTVRELMSSPFRNELDDRASRVLLPGTGETVDPVFDAIKEFGERLAHRMSWQEVSMNGPMAPREMIDLMRAAIEENEPDQNPSP